MSGSERMVRLAFGFVLILFGSPPRGGLDWLVIGCGIFQMAIGVIGNPRGGE